MSDSSFSDTLDTAKQRYAKSMSYERNWWNKADQIQKSSVLRKLTRSDFGTHYDSASENAYQQDKAKLNQLVNTTFDSLPLTVKTIITESLIERKELPNPSDFKGIGQLFEVDNSKDREVFIECDRCDEVFMDDQDFDQHKEIDHGDDDSNEQEAVEAWAHSMSPESDRYSLHEALKYVVETSEDDLHRSVYYHGDEIPRPTLTEPSGTGDDAGGNTVKGTQGYNDNPNEGLYNYKKFKHGKSTDRNGGTVTESLFDKKADEADNFEQKDFGTPEQWQQQLNGLRDEYEDHGEALDYNDDDIYGDIKVVEDKPEKNIDVLDNIDISEEAIDFVYPTKATEGKWAVEDFMDDIKKEYDGQEQSEEEAVEIFITDRKIHGYQDHNIARELEIRHGVTPEEALEKVYSVEVSVNDNLAGTFFGKRFSECTEAEIKELQLYAGSVN